MTLIDAGSIRDRDVVEADVCVIGAGPAGLATAFGLESARLRLLVIESGGLRAEPAAEFENVGAPLRASEPVRQRGIGGTTGSWYGRLGLLDQIDFVRRPWVRSSGWPIAADDVLAFAPRAAHFLGLDRPEALHPDFWERDEAFRQLSSESLRPGVHLWPRRLRIARLHLARLRRSKRTQVVIHAHARRLVPSESGALIDSLAVQGPDGGRFSVRARAYVLASGGLENPRILLLSQIADPHGVIGRHYMNHPRGDGIARLYPNRRASGSTDLIRGLTERSDRRVGGRAQFCLRPTEALMRAESLVNSCSFLYPVSPARMRTLGDALRLPPALRRAAGRLGGRGMPVDHLVMIDQVEQAPDRASRVTLGEGRDRFGDPQLMLHWTIGEESANTLRRVHELVAELVEASGIGRLETAFAADPDYAPEFTDAAHPMGTTRMSNDPRQGVVDADCRVHGVENLYVAGSSVLPTGGNGPPTLTIAALALRLSDRLARSL